MKTKMKTRVLLGLYFVAAIFGVGLAWTQDVSNPQTNATALTSGTLPAARLPALTGNVTSSAGSAVTTLAAGSASNLDSGTLLAARLPALTGDVTSSAGSAATTLAAGSASNLNSGTLPAARLPSTPIANTLAAPITLNNTGTFFDGPSVAQGTSGTWFASGTVTLIDTTGTATFQCKLWDGTTIIAAGSSRSVAINVSTTISLSGFLASPAANIRISCEDATSTSGQIQSNATGLSKDSTITAYRIN